MLKEFGYFPRALDFSIGDVAIKSLLSLGSTVEAIESHEWRNSDWIDIEAPRRVFGLPKTHSINLADGSDAKRVEFLVWVLGFLVGMRLTTTEAGYLDATPCKPGKLVDFHCSGRDLERAVGHTNQFYIRRGSTAAPGLIAAAIHALFLAQTPRLLCFERFGYLYTSLDAIWKVSVTERCLRAQTHAHRIETMCAAWGLSVPVWARYDASLSGSQLSNLRNQMVHEGLLSGEPLGFKTIQSFDGTPRQGGNPLLEMQNLICRLIVSLLQIPETEYTSSSIGTRQTSRFRVVA